MPFLDKIPTYKHIFIKYIQTKLLYERTKLFLAYQPSKYNKT